jgi:ribosome-binding ATPase YchF (GTP1/OBG family)
VLLQHRAVAKLCCFTMNRSLIMLLLQLQVLAWLEEGKDVRLGDWTAREIEFLNNWLLLTAKPAVYLVNCSKKDYIRKKNKFLPKIFEWVQANGGAPIIPFSGVFENEVCTRGAHLTCVAVPRCLASE